MYFRSSGLYRDYSALIIDDSTSFNNSRLNTIMEGMDQSRDMTSSASSTPSSMSKHMSESSGQNPLRTRLMPSASFDMASQEVDMIPERTVSFSDAVTATIKSMKDIDYRIVRLHSEVILARSTFALLKREKLIVGSLILHIFFALNFWIIMDDSSEDTNPVVGFFSVSGMVLIVANVQFGYYLFSNNEVSFIHEVVFCSF